MFLFLKWVIVGFRRCIKSCSYSGEPGNVCTYRFCSVCVSVCVSNGREKANVCLVAGKICLAFNISQHTMDICESRAENNEVKLA